MNGSGDLVANTADGTRIQWDGNGKLTSGQRSQAFADAIEIARVQAANSARPQGAAGSYQGTRYDATQMPAQDDAIYITLGPGESFWTVAEDLGLDDQGWWKLVSSNPQFQDPDKIPEGAVIAVDRDLLPDNHPLKKVPLSPDGEFIPTSDAAATSFMSGASRLPAGTGGSHPSGGYAELKDDFKRDIENMAPADRRAAMTQILGSGLSAEAKKLALDAYLETVDYNNPAEAAHAQAVVEAYLRLIPPGEQQSAAQALLGIGGGRYEGSTFTPYNSAVVGGAYEAVTGQRLHQVSYFQENPWLQFRD